MSNCRDTAEMVEERINRVLTQYRESPKLLFLIRTFLGSVAALHNEICELPERFDINSATGDQLTILGKQLGFPRCHCVCLEQPVHGFYCEGRTDGMKLSGFCDQNSDWEACSPFGVSEICINDDDMYRKFLKVRVYQHMVQYDLESLSQAVQLLWGPTAMVLDHGNGRVVVAPGRNLTPSEETFVKLYPKVLPISPGIKVLFHFGSLAVAGFGEGWGGFCDLFPDEQYALQTSNSDLLISDEPETLVTSPLKLSEWMCPIDVRPFSC